MLEVGRGSGVGATNAYFYDTATVQPQLSFLQVCFKTQTLLHDGRARVHCATHPRAARWEEEQRVRVLGSLALGVAVVTQRWLLRVRQPPGGAAGRQLGRAGDGAVASDRVVRGGLVRGQGLRGWAALKTVELPAASGGSPRRG